MKRQKNWKNLLFIFSLLLISSISHCEESYKIERIDDKIKLNFNKSWYFTKISIPVRSFAFWGDDKVHNVAAIDLNGEKHIISADSKNKFLEYSELTPEIDKISITSINSYHSNVESQEQKPEFVGVLAQTKHIEDKILLLGKEENLKFERNKCFSCHSLLPYVLLTNLAEQKGFSVDKDENQKILLNIAKIQNSEGFFYFKQQPEYGKNTTTLAALFISSMLSHFSTPDFIEISNKAESFIKNIQKEREPIETDFIFEPLFNGTTTSIFFETVFQQTFYLSNPDGKNYAHIRAVELLESILNSKNLDFQSRMLLFTGIPYSFQLKGTERAKLIEELKEYLESNSEKSSEILKLLSLYVYSKLLPNQTLPIIPLKTSIKTNSSQELWNCFKEILYNKPKHINGNYDEKQIK